MITHETTYRCPHCHKDVHIKDVIEGDVVQCPNPLCGREFKAEIPEAEQKPGLILPAGVESHSNRSESSEQNQDTNVETTPENAERAAFDSAVKDETVLGIYKTPMFRRYPFRFVGYLLLVVLGLVALVAVPFQLNTQSQVALGILGGAALAFGGYQWLSWWLHARKQVVTITKTSLVVNEDAHADQTREIHHESISSIDIYQPMMCRWMGVGSMAISWGQEKEEVYLDAVERPHELVEQVRKQAGQ